MNVVNVKPEQVVKPRMLEIVVPDTPAQDFGADDFANRLFIYTGIIILDFSSITDDRSRGTFKLDLSLLPRHRVFDDRPYHFITLPDPADSSKKILWAAPVASLASIRASDDFDVAIWAVDEVRAEEENDHLVLEIDMALQGENCILYRIAYQVNLLARRMF